MERKLIIEVAKLTGCKPGTVLPSLPPFEEILPENKSQSEESRAKINEINSTCYTKYLDATHAKADLSSI